MSREEIDFENLASPQVIRALAEKKQLTSFVKRLFPDIVQEDIENIAQGGKGGKIKGIVGQLSKFSRFPRKSAPVSGGRIQEVFIRVFEETVKVQKPEPPTEEEPFEPAAPPIFPRLVTVKVWGTFICLIYEDQKGEWHIVHTAGFNLKTPELLTQAQSLELIFRLHSIHYPQDIVIEVFRQGRELENGDIQVFDETSFEDIQDIADSLNENL